MLRAIKNKYWALRAGVRTKRYHGQFKVINFAAWCRQVTGFDPYRHLPAPEISAFSACCIDVDSGEVLSQKKLDFKSAPASIVKLATALILVRSDKLINDELVTIEASDVADPIGSNMNLKEGDLVSFRDLLYGMLLSSGNDAARATARAIGLQKLKDEAAPGDPTARFVSSMNELGHSLGMINTRFRNPSGQDTWGQYSTSHELAVLASTAFSNPTILKIISERQHVAKIQGPNARDEILHSTLDDIERDRVIGGKTGTTKTAGACLAVLAHQKGHNKVVIVTLGSRLDSNMSGSVRSSSSRRYQDMRLMINHARNM